MARGTFHSLCPFYRGLSCGSVMVSTDVRSAPSRATRIPIDVLLSVPYDCLESTRTVSALGRIPSFRTLPSQRQLSGAKETLGNNFPQPKSDRQLLRMKQSFNPIEKLCGEGRKTAINRHSRVIGPKPIVRRMPGSDFVLHRRYFT